MEPYTRPIYTITTPSQLPQPSHLIPLTWGSSHIASLPLSLLATQLPHLYSLHLRRGGSYLDIRSRLLDSYTPSPPDRYRKAAIVVITHFASLLSPTSDEPTLPRYLEKKLDDSEHKLLRHFSGIIHVSRAFGCIPGVRMALEHFLLVQGRTLEEREEWLEILGELVSRGQVREEIEGRLGAEKWERMSSTEANVGDLPRGRGFEASLVGRGMGRDGEQAVREWRGCMSIFAAVEPEYLQDMLGRLGEGNTLVPPGAASEGGVLDPIGGVVCVEIKRLDYMGLGGTVLGEHVGEWLARGARRGWRGTERTQGDWMLPEREDWRD